MANVGLPTMLRTIRHRLAWSIVHPRLRRSASLSLRVGGFHLASSEGIEKVSPGVVG